jgi:hypothetical protein
LRTKSVDRCSGKMCPCQAQVMSKVARRVSGIGHLSCGNYEDDGNMNANNSIRVVVPLKTEETVKSCQTQREKFNLRNISHTLSLFLDFIIIYFSI